MISVVKKPSENSGSPELRMWLLVRVDLRMPLGKFAAQAGHGYTTCLWLSSQRDPVLVETYMRHSQAKIAVSVRHEQELLACVAGMRGGGPYCRGYQGCRAYCVRTTDRHGRSSWSELPERSS